MKRLRLTMVHEFDWESEEFSETDADRLVQNFLRDPAGFMALDSLAFDEIILVDVEDISDAS